MQTVEEIAKLLKSDIRPAADKLLKVHEKEKKELADQIRGLDSAIKDKQKRLIKMHTKELESEVKQLAIRLNHTAKLLSRLDKLDPEDGFGPNLKEVTKLTKELGELERKLTNNYAVAKKEVDKGRDAMEADDAEVDEEEVVQQWAILEGYLDAILKATKAEMKVARTSHAKAKQAVASRDVKELQSANTALQALDVIDQPSKDLLSKEAGLWKTFDPKKLSKSLQQQLGRDRAKFEKIIKELVQLEAEAAKLLKEVQALRLKPVDHKKAATVLKIPKTHVAKLQKMLALDEARMLKGFDALAKELKLKTKSKDMVQALKKAKVL